MRKTFRKEWETTPSTGPPRLSVLMTELFQKSTVTHGPGLSDFIIT